MQDMRYLNLFNQITHVPTRFCFKYNDFIIYCVSKPLVSKAIGEQGKNIKRIREILRAKVKVIPKPSGIGDARHFIANIISPVSFKDLEIKENELIITAGSRNKAALLGRNKRRYLEMHKIVKDFFGKELKIV